MKKRSSLTPQDRRCLKALGAKIREARLSKGWTLEDAEEHGWRAWQHLQQIEAGTKNINFTTLLRLLKLFDLDPTETIGDLTP